MADSIRISQLELIDEITIDDRIVINNENVNTNAIKFSNFINSIETYPLLTFEGTVVFEGAVQLPENLNIKMSLNALDDVTMTDKGSGDILVWTGTTWTNQPNDAIVLTNLSVTTAPLPEAGGKLEYDSTNGTFTFTPAAVPETYNLPVASASQLGGVKVGDRLRVAPDGTLTADEQTPPVATGLVSGTVKVGQYLKMDVGVLSVDDTALASSDQITKVATTTTLGQIKVGDGLTITNEGFLRADLTYLENNIEIDPDELEITNYYNKPETDALLNAKADSATTYSISQVDSALSGKADLNSPTFTGAPTAPTAANGTATQQVANCAFVAGEIANLNTSIANAASTNSDNTYSGINVFNGVIQGTAEQNWIRFYFDSQANFPSATTAHGAVLHSHNDGAMFFAHGGTWNKLAASSEIAGEVASALGDYTPTANLATVATTGSYGDLQNTPTLATVATTGAYTDLSGTPTLATVATSGSYNDLSDQPTIPTQDLATILSLLGLQQFADDAAATGGGLATGDIYYSSNASKLVVHA